MRAWSWLMLVVLPGCIGASATGRLSPAGLTTVMVTGNASDVVLVDPGGRVSRLVEMETDVPIPDFNRWDGGTETFLEDSTSSADTRSPTVVVTNLELAKPIVGRYRLYVRVEAGTNTSIVVTPVGALDANFTCKNLNDDAKREQGRYLWYIDFAADVKRKACPVRVSSAMRVATENQE